MAKAIRVAEEVEFWQYKENKTPLPPPVREVPVPGAGYLTAKMFTPHGNLEPKDGDIIVRDTQGNLQIYSAENFLDHFEIIKEN